jgi:hypothetical protein
MSVLAFKWDYSRSLLKPALNKTTDSTADRFCGMCSAEKQVWSLKNEAASIFTISLWKTKKKKTLPNIHKTLIQPPEKGS